MGDGKLTVLNYDGKSSTLLNAIRAEASAQYKAQIPSATQDNLELVMSSINKFELTRNEYAYAVLDKIAFTEIGNASFNNPLRRFKKAKYSTGKDIEELFVDLIKSQQYDASSGSIALFKRYLPTILSVYHTLNRTDVYPITIEEDLLSLAFTSEEQGMTMISAIMASLHTSDNYDEFLIMKNLLNANIVEGRMAIQVVSPVVDEDTAKAFVTKVKERSKDMLFMSPTYNFAGVRNTAPIENQLFMSTPAIMSIIDVEVLAVAFNMEKVVFESEQVLVDDFGSDDSNVIAILCDERWLRVRDRLREMRMQANGATLSYNTFQHVWQSVSSSPFHNAIAFVTVAPTLSAIDVLPATASVKAGAFEQFRVETTGTGYPPSKCSWAHNGTSDDTFITSTGLLYVGADETTTPITVTATSLFLGTITDTAAVTVT